MKRFENEVRDFSLRLGGFIGAFLAVIAIFLIIPLFSRSFITHMALQCSFIFLLISTIYSIGRDKKILVIGLCFLMPYIVFDLLSLYNNSLTFMMSAYAFCLIFTFLAMCILVKKILWAPKIDTNLIFGSVTVYLLAAVLWAKMFFIENTFFPGSFKSVDVNFATAILENAYDVQFNLFYYSFTVITTLGLGDIQPIHNLAKSLTAIEAMFGQLFIAVIVSKLVSTWQNTTIGKI